MYIYCITCKYLMNFFIQCLQRFYLEIFKHVHTWGLHGYQIKRLMPEMLFYDTLRGLFITFDVLHFVTSLFLSYFRKRFVDFYPKFRMRNNNSGTGPAFQKRETNSELPDRLFRIQNNHSGSTLCQKLYHAKSGIHCHHFSCMPLVENRRTFYFTILGVQGRRES